MQAPRNDTHSLSFAVPFAPTRLGRSSSFPHAVGHSHSPSFITASSAQGTRYATVCPRHGFQPRSAVMPNMPLSGFCWSTEVVGSKGKIGFLGIIGSVWAGSATSDCVEKNNVSTPGSWIIGQFGQREGVACVASAPGKGEKSGVVWHGLAARAHRVSDKKLNTIPVKSLEVWHLGQREGGVCVVVDISGGRSR